MEGSAAVPIDRRLSREAAFERLVARELPAAYRTAAVILGDEAEAQDATQDALVRAWQQLDRLRDEERAGAWFGRILVNVCLDRLRKRQTATIRWLPMNVASESAGDSGEREAIWQALAVLNPDQRIVIVLRYYLDLPLESIAERTDAPLGTVKSRLHHALRAARAAYEAQDRVGEERR